MVFWRASKSTKISSEIKLRLWSNSINVTSSCDLFLIDTVSLNNIKY
jgi:hypothetical protein